ncbi:acyltransferase domain-containing protein [Streptomyces sp. ML-6]|nr:acyltransferase domain-containing protein [Streptomyces sp. ML-6]MDK0524472.1 acyltransferase domain-containing protein [Streptomyces sp. ML-6]
MAEATSRATGAEATSRATGADVLRELFALPPGGSSPAPPGGEHLNACAALWTHPGHQDDAQDAGRFLEGAPATQGTHEALAQAVRTLIHAGRPRRAADWCRRLQERTAPHRAPGLRALYGTLHGEALLRLGDLAGAEREAFDAACSFLDRELAQELGRGSVGSLREVVFAGPGSKAGRLLDETVFTQAGLFAVESALFALVSWLGVRPDAVMGHSLGEITAAWAAGVFCLEDACTLVAARGRLMQAARPGGAMATIAAPETEVTEHLAGYGGRVAVAAVNGPAAVVVSGATDAVTEIADHFRAQGTRTKHLTVSHAFHSPHMDTAADTFGRALAGITFHEPTLPVISNLTGTVAEPGTLTTPAYWARHIRAAVRFHDGITTLHTRGITACLELGPDPVLTSMARDALDGQGIAAACVLQRDKGEARALLRALAVAFTSGTRTDWAPLLGPGRRTALPTYPFQRKRYWIDVPGLTAPAPGPGALTGAPADNEPEEEDNESWAGRLRGLTDGQRITLIADLIRRHTVEILEYDTEDEVDRALPFKELGYNSLTWVELRSRLAADLGIALPSSLVYDHPTPRCWPVTSWRRCSGPPARPTCPRPRAPPTTSPWPSWAWPAATRAV